MTGYVEAASGMKDDEFTLLLKPFSVDALAGAMGITATRQEFESHP
jgi:hypothetical protein